jgi:tetratricopeptide (TPR) repeat protein
MIDPTDNASRRNLSSAQYELGKYSQAIDVIDEAHRKEKDINKRSALLIRKAKCLIHLGRVEEVKETLNKYEGTDGDFWGKDEGVWQMRQ